MTATGSAHVPPRTDPALTTRISVVGLGKLGAPLLAVLAGAGNTVIGLDASQSVVDKIQAGIAPVEEPGLQAMLDSNRARISATTDWARAIGATDVTFIIVPTPSGPNGEFLNDHVLAAVAQIGAVLAAKPEYHLVVVNSTTMPGSMESSIRKSLERSSGHPIGERIGLCYNPEFIALGNVIEGLLHPDFVLIGESDRRAGDLLESLYRGVVGDGTPIARMNFVNAEIAKISVNTYVTTKISFANMLSEVCGRLAGADVDVVTGAIGLDARIGGKFLRGATAYGGPCFPRDTVAFSTMSRGLGLGADLADAAEAVNTRQTERLAALISEAVAPGARVALLGMAYKAGTPVIDRSAGVDLASRLTRSGYDVTVHDPMAIDAARRMLGDLVSYATTISDAVLGAAVVVVLVPWPEYRRLDATNFGPGTPLVIDCWRLLDPASFDDVRRLVRLGRGEAADEGGVARPLAAE